MECPKCHFDHPQQTTECLKCGVIFSKFLALQQANTAAAPAPAPVTTPLVSEDFSELRAKAHTEFLCRVIAVPAALLFGWIVNWAMPSMSAFLAMWLHESGHAIAAWLCGYNAFPTAWITVIGERGRWISVFMGAGVAFGGYVAFRLERWFWVAICALVLLLFVAGNLQTDFHAHMLFTFWGDGGAFVLSTLLMATFFARPEHPVSRNQVRWGLLILGAIAFCSVYSRWSGGFENIANFLEDTDERGPSDIMQLTTMYGWSIFTLIHTYWRLAHACLVGLGIAYAAGVWQAKRAESALAQE
jgi:hypothetical protein